MTADTKHQAIISPVSLFSHLLRKSEQVLFGNVHSANAVRYNNAATTGCSISNHC